MNDQIRELSLDEMDQVSGGLCRVYRCFAWTDDQGNQICEYEWVTC